MNQTKSDMRNRLSPDIRRAYDDKSHWGSIRKMVLRKSGYLDELLGQSL